MPLKIEKNVPVYRNPSKELVSFLLSMKDGDSVFIPYEEYNKSICNNSITSARLRATAVGIKYITRGSTDGVRVWAIKNEINK